MLWWHRDVKLTEFRLEVVYIGVVVLGVFVLIDGCYEIIDLVYHLVDRVGLVRKEVHVGYVNDVNEGGRILLLDWFRGLYLLVA